MRFKIPFFIYCVLILLSFNSCKKYPENTLWFKKPEKVFKGGKITSYTMNGQDRMPYYRNLYAVFPYNYFGNSIPDVFDMSFDYNSSTGSFGNELGDGTFKFSKTKREVEIYFSPLNEVYGAENIFIHHLSWKILKLTKTGQLKIAADYDFKRYEIQFN